MNRTASDRRPANNRSKITNGVELLPGVHSQSVWARRFRDLIELHAVDLGGPEQCSHAEQSIIRRAAALTVELELLESRFATETATPEQLDLYSRLSNTLRRMLETVGINRRAKDVPNLQRYLRDREAAGS